MFSPFNTAGLFDSIARGYDRFNHLSSLGIDRAWRRRLVSLCSFADTDRCLDLACGTGDVSLALSRRYPLMQVTGMDISRKMLQEAERKLKKASAKKKFPHPPVFLYGDATCLPLESDTFRVATMAFGIRNVPDRPRALAELYRVLRPDGRLCILEFAMPPNFVLGWLYKLYFKHVMPVWGACLTGTTKPFRYFYDSVCAFPKFGGFCRELEVAGFKDICHKKLTFGIAVIYSAQK